MLKESINFELVEEMILALDDIMAELYAKGDEDSFENEAFIRGELQDMFPEATPAEIQEAMDSF